MEEVIIECKYGRKPPRGAEGNACEYIFKNKKYRCSSFVYLSGKDPQSEEEFKEIGRCLDQWIPFLLVENAQTNRGQTQALESFRNEVVKDQQELNIIAAAASNRQIG